jgi:dienelactone hydrolase
MGGSRGAQSSIYASMVRFQKMYGPADQEFGAYIGMYTPCGTTYHNDEDVAAKPIRLLHGTADDYVPVAPCRQYVERLTKAGRDIRLVEYPGAYHVFDAPVFKQPLKIPAPTTRACVTEESENGVVIDSKTRQPFTYDDPCVEKGVTLAYDEAATSQAKSYVGEFLSGVFALK